MAELISAPTRIPVPGGKVIDEYVGRVNSGSESVFVAYMQAPPGWTEPAQTPEFDEITLVLRGMVRAEVPSEIGGVKTLDVRAGQALLTRAGRGCATPPARSRRSTSRSACRRSARRR